MIWLVTIPMALLAAYSLLCIVLNAATRSGRSTPYWVLLAVSVASLYMAWVHSLRISFE